MRAIKIDAKERTITEIDIKDDYREMQKVVNGAFTIAFYFPDERHLCFVNDEGLLNDPQYFFGSDYYPRPFAGNGLIMGCNNNTGKGLPCKLDIEELKKSINFYSLDEIQEMIRRGLVDYNIYITTSEGTEKISDIDLGAWDSLWARIKEE